MADTEQQLFIMGLQGAGKTSFLAALWHVVESEEVTGSLKLVRLFGDAGYLNEIRKRWLGAEPLERTKLSDQTNVMMHLESTDGVRFQLWIPDLSGEEFEAQWTERVASTEYCNYVRESHGGVLFLHPNIRQEHLIEEIRALVPLDEEGEDMVLENDGGAARGVEPAEGRARAIQDVEDYVPWDPRLAPTQVQLVELLQFVSEIRSGRAAKLAVVISAWDAVQPAITPEQWIETYTPLLHQFLSTHKNSLDVAYFGVSAQGGPIDTPEGVNALLAHQNAANRIQVHDGQSLGHDITTPIGWVLRPIVVNGGIAT